MTTSKLLSWNDIQTEVGNLAERNNRVTLSSAITHVYGIPQGGAPVAIMLANKVGLELANEPIPGRTLIVDDLVDTGTTMEKYQTQGYKCDALYRKPWSPEHLAPEATTVDQWLSFPWEKDDGAPTDAVIRLLQHIGEDPTRDGLKDTPKRVAKAWREMTSGYELHPAEILKTTFDVHHDELIVLTGIEYWSLCEHHVLPFHGKATVGYIPNPGARIVGLSKLARLVEAFSKRLQVQERLTNQIAEALQEHLDPRGVGVVMSGTHSCMAARGIRKQGEMVTSCLLGDMRTDAAMRAEFLHLASNGNR